YMVSRGVERSPELQQLDAAIAAQERTLSSARMSYFLPTIGAYAKYSNNFYKSTQPIPFSLSTIPAPPAGLDPAVPAYLGQLLSGMATPLPDRQDWTVGLQLSLNIFQGFGTRAAESKASEQLEQYRLQRDASVERVALRVRSEMQNARTSFFAIEQSRVEQEASRKVLNIVTDAYSQGAVSILNLLDAQNSALRANQVAVNAQYDFLITYMSLQRSLGQFDILMTSSERERFLSELLKFMESSLSR
ncbi:MAG TPA: TolC family protein, partial [Bacteroidota bacterium]